MPLVSLNLGHFEYSTFGEPSFQLSASAHARLPSPLAPAFPSLKDFEDLNFITAGNAYIIGGIGTAITLKFHLYLTNCLVHEVLHISDLIISNFIKDEVSSSRPQRIGS